VTGRPILILAVAAVLGCGKKEQAPTRDAYVEIASRDDHSLCTGYGDGHEAEESSAPGAPGRSIRRVYAIVGSGQYIGRVLVCREVDTNYDGLKDLVRTYDRRGVRLTENADANYDGQLDTWTAYSSGRIGKASLDTDFDGKVDEVRYYREGRIVRIHRDTDRDGQEDTFEMYRDGKLERIGVDLDRSGHVDEWYGADDSAPPEAKPDAETDVDEDPKEQATPATDRSGS
jgi:hypothetical protein